MDSLPTTSCPDSSEPTAEVTVGSRRRFRAGLVTALAALERRVDLVGIHDVRRGVRRHAAVALPRVRSRRGSADGRCWRLSRGNGGGRPWPWANPGKRWAGWRWPIASSGGGRELAHQQGIPRPARGIERWERIAALLATPEPQRSCSTPLSVDVVGPADETGVPDVEGKSTFLVSGPSVAPMAVSAPDRSGRAAHRSRPHGTGRDRTPP